jgi:hypothetical protein
MIDLGGRRNLLMHLDDARLPLTDGTAGILAGFAETSASSRSRSFVTSQHAVQVRARFGDCGVELPDDDLDAAAGEHRSLTAFRATGRRAPVSDT